MNERAKKLMDEATKPIKKIKIRLPNFNVTFVGLFVFIVVFGVLDFIDERQFDDLTDTVYDNEAKVEAYVDLLVEDDKAIRERVGTLEEYYSELDEDVEDLRFDLASQDLQVVIEDMEWTQEQRDICQEEEENQDDCELRLNELACDCGNEAYAYSWRDNDEYVTVCFKSECELDEGDY